MTFMEATSKGSLTIQEQENKLLQALAQHQKSLRVAKIEELAPGTPIYYKLGADYGCHVIRTVEEAREQPYKDKAGLRAGVEAGHFYILADDGQQNSPAAAGNS